MFCNALQSGWNCNKVWISALFSCQDRRMTESENQFLTRIGPGTPMSNLMRQYWIPVLQSTDLPERDGASLRVGILCENLVAFRNSDGKVGLIDPVCPHRCASLFFGRNEDNGLRCPYHGWKFDVDGHCVDVPNEPPRSKFNGQIKVTAYSCVEKMASFGPPAVCMETSCCSEKKIPGQGVTPPQ